MARTMQVRFWGVRGSLPCPGPATLRYGGNTPCVSITKCKNTTGDPDADECRPTLVLDAGTGIRVLGKKLYGTGEEILVLVTHLHSDHTQGFPFFAPIYEKDRPVYLFPTLHRTKMVCAALEGMDGAHFPLTPDQLPSKVLCVGNDEHDVLAAHGFGVSKIATNHPGGCVGFKVQHGGRTVVFIPDNELDPPGKKTTEFDAFVEFCRGADVLIHDAQYLDEDMKTKRGWGHSTVNHAVALGLAANVAHLVLFHHDPERSDDALDQIQADARARVAAAGSATQCSVAHEGMALKLTCVG